MTSSISLQQFQKIRHVDEIIEVAKDSWWVVRRSIEGNGRLSNAPRVVFFGQSKEDTEKWLARH